MEDLIINVTSMIAEGVGCDKADVVITPRAERNIFDRISVFGKTVGGVFNKSTESRRKNRVGYMCASMAVEAIDAEVRRHDRGPGEDIPDEQHGRLLWYKFPFEPGDGPDAWVEPFDADEIRDMFPKWYIEIWGLNRLFHYDVADVLAEMTFQEIHNDFEDLIRENEHRPDVNNLRPFLFL